MAKKNEVIEKPATDVALPSDLMADMLADAGKGTQIDSSDIAIPFLSILEALSCQLKARDPKYIEGAKQGDFCLSVENKAYSSPIHFIPVNYKKVFVEWKPDREGFAGVHDCLPNDAVLGSDGRYYTDSGNSLTETNQHFILLIDGDTFKQAIIPMSATRLKASRQLNSLIVQARATLNGKTFSPPCYGTIYTAESVEESGKRGDYHNWSFKRCMEHALLTDGLLNNAALYNEAKSLYELIAKGAMANKLEASMKAEAESYSQTSIVNNDAEIDAVADDVI